ncbi:hypothetical protein TNCT_551091 [Trichonephila clavata]|uniref:Zinc finger BED domain-containing protein 5 n=1 Tax=Trichonephila clavata TaxID=2740835 RepID=A0A8X6F277_TRICU|nr:hypothetical protein TNCT_551091 [Trichonephila clavata]
MAEYPEIATSAFKSLLPFLTTYLCEAGFSAVAATETKQRNKQDKQHTLGVTVPYYSQMELSRRKGTCSLT